MSHVSVLNESPDNSCSPEPIAYRHMQIKYNNIKTLLIFYGFFNHIYSILAINSFFYKPNLLDLCEKVLQHKEIVRRVVDNEHIFYLVRLILDMLKSSLCLLILIYSYATVRFRLILNEV